MCLFYRRILLIAQITYSQIVWQDLQGNNHDPTAIEFQYSIGRNEKSQEKPQSL
jgi:hypothetical protein